MSNVDTTANETFMSLNGFDEIAIAAHFGSKVTDLREDPFSFLRALIFVTNRRSGMKDTEAREAALNLTLAEVTDYFAKDSDDAEDEDDLGKRAERLTYEDMAHFCLSTGVQPSEWKALTKAERNAFARVSHEIAEQMRRK